MDGRRDRAEADLVRHGQGDGADEVAGVGGDDGGADDAIGALGDVDANEPVLFAVEDGAIDFVEPLRIGIDIDPLLAGLGGIGRLALVSPEHVFEIR